MQPLTRVENPTASYARLLTRHAQARMQQRAVPIAVLARLLDYGAGAHRAAKALDVQFDALANEAQSSLLENNQVTHECVQLRITQRQSQPVVL